MPVLMMTSIDTIYEVSCQDTVPVIRPGAPHIEAQFNGLTQIQLLASVANTAAQNAAEVSFKQQQKYLQDAAQAAVAAFNPVTTSHLLFRATVKLQSQTGQIQAFDYNSESSGLAYCLSLALTWGYYKDLLAERYTDHIFATGAVPVDGYVTPIGHRTQKLLHTCNQFENKTDIKHFLIIIPQDNVDDLNNSPELLQRIARLGGEIIGITHISEALQLIANNDFDGGIYPGNHSQFPGLAAISYNKRHLFLGRDVLVKQLFDNSLQSLKKNTFTMLLA